MAKARTRRRRPVEPLISRAACLRPGPAFIPPGRAAGPWVECPDRTVPWRHDRSRPVGRVGDGRRPWGRGWWPAGPDPPDLWAAPLDVAKARARVHEKVYRRGPGQCHYWLGSLSSSRHGRVRPGVRTTTARRPARCQRRTSRPVNRPGRSTAPRSGLLPPARHLPPQRQQQPRSARRGGPNQPAWPSATRLAELALRCRNITFYPPAQHPYQPAPSIPPRAAGTFIDPTGMETGRRGSPSVARRSVFADRSGSPDACPGAVVPAPSPCR